MIGVHFIFLHNIDDDEWKTGDLKNGFMVFYQVKQLAIKIDQKDSPRAKK